MPLRSSSIGLAAFALACGCAHTPTPLPDRELLALLASGALVQGRGEVVCVQEQSGLRCVWLRDEPNGTMWSRRLPAPLSSVAVGFDVEQGANASVCVLTGARMLVCADQRGPVRRQRVPASIGFLGLSFPWMCLITEAGGLDCPDAPWIAAALGEPWPGLTFAARRFAFGPWLCVVDEGGVEVTCVDGYSYDPGQRRLVERFSISLPAGQSWHRAVVQEICARGHADCPEFEELLALPLTSQIEAAVDGDDFVCVRYTGTPWRCRVRAADGTLGAVAELAGNGVLVRQGGGSCTIEPGGLRCGPAQ